MPSLSGISFNWALFIIGLIIVFYGLRAALGYRNVARDAKEDYEFKVANNMTPQNISKEGYIQAYRRFHNPRSSLYVALTLSALLLLTPIVMIVIQFLLEQLYHATGRSRVFEPGYLVWQFFIYFLLLMSWAGIAFTGARRYHQRAPGSLAQEIKKNAIKKHEDKETRLSE